MALRLNKLSMPIQRCVLRKGARVFALLGKATPFGIAPFNRHDVTLNWGLTAEFGCLRLERLSGEEEVTGTRVFLPTASSYDYGVGGPGGTLEVAKSVFGLLPFELEQLITVVRKGNVPMLGFSHADQRCSISTCVIPGYWPHVVISNLASYGNIVSLETFMRVMVSSLPQGRLAVRYPDLQQLLSRMQLLITLQRPGIPYSSEIVDFAVAPPVAALKA
jgi:hypothetical protein